MELNYLSIFISAFITVIVGIALISNLGNSVDSAITPGTVTNESLQFLDSVTASTTEDDLLSITLFSNSSHDFASDVGTLFNFTAAGVITIDNASIVAGNTTGIPDGRYNISYNFMHDDYVDDSTSRSLLPLMIIFFAIAIVLIGIAVFVKLKPQF